MTLLDEDLSFPHVKVIYPTAVPRYVKFEKLELLYHIRLHGGYHCLSSVISADPANTKHLYNICTTSAQRLRRWSNIVQMLYKCFVFSGVMVNFVTINPFPAKLHY